MNTGDLRAVALVLLALLAVGAVASTLDAGSGPAGTPERPDEPDQPGVTPGNAPNSDGFGSGIDWPSASCPPVLTDWRALGGLVLALLAFGGVVYRIRRSPFVPAVLLAPFLVGLVTFCGSALQTGSLLPSVAGNWTPSTSVLVGVLLAIVGGVAALLYVVTGSDERLQPATGEEEPEVDLAAVGDAAGDAADRIERQADVTNEVYRAWREMTAHLDVAHAEATTPSEFAEAAIEAGMEPEDVATLTRLFEEVRYGDKDPEAREEQAVSALRGIERAYGGGDE